MTSIFKEKPTINCHADALKVILKIALDKNERVLKDDQIEWLETKLKEITKVARKGLKMGVINI